MNGPMKRRALITGDLGFVGRHMRSALEEHGWSVYGLDVKRGRAEDVRYWFSEGSKDVQYDLVVHCAAVVGGRETIEGNPIATAVDLAIDAEMFGWAVRTQQPRIVYYSSSAAYPIELQSSKSSKVLAESDLNLQAIRNPDMIYGWAKLTGEHIAASVEELGTRVHIFRPFSGYGADQDLSYPWPAMARRASRKEDPFTVWGDGTQVRDFIHIHDIVSGTLAAVESGSSGPLNLCTGIGTSMDELAKMFMSAAGYSAHIVHDTYKPSGVQARVGSPVKMNEVYSARVGLEETIRTQYWRGN